MKKVFISLPMKDKLRSEIISEQAKILARVNEILGETVMLIENYMRELYSQKPLECLGENIKRMSEAEMPPCIASRNEAACLTSAPSRVCNESGHVFRYFLASLRHAETSRVLVVFLLLVK